MNCKGCAGQVFYTPLAEVNEKDRAYTGAALRHVPSTPTCEWFTLTPASQIIAYIKVAQCKISQHSEAPRLFE